MKERSITLVAALILVLLGSAAYLGLGARPAKADTPPVASRTPSSIDFGSQQVGTTSAPRIITVTAEQDGVVAEECWPDKPVCIPIYGGTTIWGLPISGPGTAAFTVSGEDCIGRELLEGDTCSIAVTFSPVATGTYAATLDIGSSSLWVTGNRVQLSGNAPPPNDAFANAQVIGSDANSVDGTTAGATREPSEPDHYTPVPGDVDWEGDHSVWYRWTAPASGRVTMDTCQANIDSILAVYTGSQLDALNRVADNNNDHTYCPSGSWGSKVTFDAQAGTTYHIAVGDAGGARENTFTLRLKDIVAPTITKVVPAPGRTGVSARTNVSAYFSEAMNAATVNGSTFTLLRNGTTTPVSATVSYDAVSKRAILDPSGDLRPGATYFATIKGGSTGVKDLAGNSLVRNKTWAFTVAG